MGTGFDIVFIGVTDYEADEVFNACKDELIKQESHLSIYNPESFFSLFNRSQKEKTFDLDLETAHLFRNLFEFYEKTNGYFDFSIHNREASGEADRKITNYSDLHISEKLEFDFNKGMIKKKSDDVKIDSGGFGKGYVLDKIKNILTDNNFEDVFISFGGSSVLCIGSHSSGSGWPVGIKDFMDPHKNMYAFQLKDASLSSSGNTLNNMGKYPEGHIANPKTGKLITGLQQVAVVGPSAFTSEVLSTALISCENEDVKDDIIEKYTDYKAVRFLFKEEGQENLITEMK